jgi:hypothetical protein
VTTFSSLPAFAGILPLIATFTAAAKTKTETLRTDEDVFETWTTFVVSGEQLVAFGENDKAVPGIDVESWQSGRTLVTRARDLIADMARARVPMPKSTEDLCEAFVRYRARLAAGGSASFNRRLAFAAESDARRP